MYLIKKFHDLDILYIDELQSSILVNEQHMIGRVMEEQALRVTYDDQTE